MSRSPRTNIAIAALALFSGVSTVGCGKIAEKATEKATEKVAEKAIESEGGGNAKVDIGKDGKVQIETDDGSLSINSGEVPDSWPDDVPFPSGLKVQGNISTPDGTNITATTSMSVADVMAFYADALQGWTASGEFNSSSEGSTNAGAQYELDGRTLSVNAGSTDEATVVNVTHADTPAG